MTQRSEQPTAESLKQAREFLFPHNVYPQDYGDWMHEDAALLAALLDREKAKARLEEHEAACEVCAINKLDREMNYTPMRGPEKCDRRAALEQAVSKP